MPRSGPSAFRYLGLLYAASEALTHGNCLRSVVGATERLRRIAPEHAMLPALDAKIATMRTIERLAHDAIALTDDLDTEADHGIEEFSRKR